MLVCSFCHRCYETADISCAEAGHPPLSETRNGSPEMIAGYRLDYLLESFINGGIYRASQTTSGRSCRITILSTDAQNSQQFLAETKHAAALFHPNVVDVYEADSLENGEVFVVAEDPDGESLRELLKTVGVPHLLTSIQVVRQTAEALHAIHLKGLTHRAINPENIILTTDSEHRLQVRIKDLDFGGVIEQSIVSNKFFIDSTINSLKYFAPEQCSGEAVSMKTDVYSLGIVLYEMLAGVPPFEAEKAAGLIDKHKNQRPPDIKIDNFELRMLLTHTLMESLTKHPGMRQSSANVFARQMRHIEQLATHVSTPPPAGVVPPAPPRTAAVVTAAVVPARFAVSPRAAMMETSKTIYEEITQPLTAVADREPVVVFEAASDSSVTAFEGESEPIADIDWGGSLMVIPDVLSEEPVIENFVKERSAPKTSRLSRLRIRMKKLHVSTAPPSHEIIKSFPAVAPTPVIPDQVQAVPAQKTAHQAVPEKIAVVPFRSLPAKIEWIQPDDDIPSVADALAALSEPPAVAGGLPLPGKPARIEWNQPEDDIPSVADVLAALSEPQAPLLPEERWSRFTDGVVGVAGGLPVPQVISAVKAEPEAFIVVPPPFKGEPKGIPVNCEEPEEITIVRARSKPIRIEWEQPAVPRNFVPAERVSARKRDEVTFFPTILGAAGKGKTIDPDRREALFSAYYPSSQSRFSARYRSLMIVVGFAALIALFLFGDDIVRSYSGTEDTIGSAAAKTITKQESLPPLRQTDDVTPAKQKAVNNFRKPAPADNDSQAMPSPSRERYPLSSEISQTSVVRTGVQNRTSKTPTLRQNVGKTALAPSTLVISSDKGKIKLNTESEKNPADKKPRSSPNKANSTRPRIVKDPKP